MSQSPPRENTPSTDLSVSSIGSGSSSTGCGEGHSAHTALLPQSNSLSSSSSSASNIQRLFLRPTLPSSATTPVLVMSVIWEKTSAEDMLGKLVPEKQTGADFIDMAMTIKADISPASVDRFYLLITSGLQYPRYFLYAAADLIFKKLGIQSVPNSKDPTWITKVNAFIQDNKTEIDTIAKGMTKMAGDRWVAENSSSINLLRQHFSGKFEILNWEQAEGSIETGQNASKTRQHDVFVKRFEFLKYLYELQIRSGSRNWSSEEINGTPCWQGVDLLPIPGIRKPAGSLQRATNIVTGLFYNLMPIYISKLLPEKLIKAQLREILFLESVARTCWKFTHEIYRGLPNTAEEIVENLFVSSHGQMITTAIGTSEEMERWTKESEIETSSAPKTSSMLPSAPTHKPEPQASLPTVLRSHSTPLTKKEKAKFCQQQEGKEEQDSTDDDSECEVILLRGKGKYVRKILNDLLREPLTSHNPMFFTTRRKGSLAAEGEKPLPAAPIVKKTS